jgi:hypothetical protein
VPCRTFCNAKIDLRIHRQKDHEECWQQGVFPIFCVHDIGQHLKLTKILPGKNLAICNEEKAGTMNFDPALILI